MVADDDVRIRIVREQWHQRRHAIAHVATHQQPALLVDVVTKRQLREVTAFERDENAAQESAEEDAAVALIGRQIVRLALRVIEFLLPRLHVDVGVGQFAEIDLRARYGDTLHRALDGHVTQNQRR